MLLSLGVRYDVQLIPGPDLPNATNPVAFNATSQINPDLHMIQPRFGFNWNPYPGTVLRGGIGMFYGQVGNSAYYTLRRENGVYQKQYGTITPAITPVPYVAAGGTVTGSGTTPGACAPTGGATLCYTNPGGFAATAPRGGIPIATPPGPAPTNPPDRCGHHCNGARRPWNLAAHRSRHGSQLLEPPLHLL